MEINTLKLNKKIYIKIAAENGRANLNNKISAISFFYHDKVDPSDLYACYVLSVQMRSLDGRKNCKKVRDMYPQQQFTLSWLIYHFECLVP